MSILNLNTSQGRGPVGKKSVKIWMGVGLLAAVLGFGSTFAANITLNSNTSPTEFGQGVQRTVYCGGSAVTLTLKPTSTFKSSSNSFAVGGISVTGIPAACKSLNFVLGVYKDDSDSRQQIASYSTSYLTTPTVYWTDASTAYVYKSSDRTSSSGCQLASKTTSPASLASAGGALLSLSSTAYEDPCRVAYLSSVTPSDKTTGNGAFTISIRSDAESRMSLADYDKMTVETQSDAFGVAQTTGSGTRGVVNN
jgi:hypothetical protein